MWAQKEWERRSNLIGAAQKAGEALGLFASDSTPNRRPLPLDRLPSDPRWQFSFWERFASKLQTQMPRNHFLPFSPDVLVCCLENVDERQNERRRYIVLRTGVNRG